MSALCVVVVGRQTATLIEAIETMEVPTDSMEQFFTLLNECWLYQCLQKLRRHTTIISLNCKLLLFDVSYPVGLPKEDELAHIEKHISPNGKLLHHLDGPG